MAAENPSVLRLNEAIERGEIYGFGFKIFNALDSRTSGTSPTIKNIPLLEYLLSKNISITMLKDAEIKKWINFETIFSSGDTAFHIAVRNRNTKLLTYLISEVRGDKLAQILLVKNSSGKTAIYEAAASGNIDFVTTLLQPSTLEYLNKSSEWKTGEKISIREKAKIGIFTPEINKFIESVTRRSLGEVALNRVSRAVSRAVSSIIPFSYGAGAGAGAGSGAAGAVRTSGLPVNTNLGKTPKNPPIGSATINVSSIYNSQLGGARRKRRTLRRKRSSNRRRHQSRRR
jgi:hypothetical protein